MGLIWNPFTGNFDFTGTSGGGGGTISGSIAAPQVAFGTGVDTIGGSTDFTWDGTTVNFTSAHGLSFATSSGPITVTGGDSGADDPALIIDNPTDDYLFLRFPHYVELLNDSGGLDIKAPLIGLVGPTYVLGNMTVNVATGTALDAQVDVVADTAAGQNGVQGVAQISGTASSTVEGLTGVYGLVQANNTAHIDNAFSFYGTAVKAAGATITNLTTFYGPNLNGLATQPYYFWADSQGVYRIREDTVADTASHPQAVPALYNPRFTKYTPGATNYERLVQQWEANVATLTTEAGGTGTLRALNLGDAGVQVQVNGKSLTLAGSLTIAGAFASTFTMTGATAVTFPTSGTLLSASGSGTSLTFPGTLSIASGKTFTASNTLTLTGTDSSSIAFGAGGTVQYKGITKRVSVVGFATLPDTSGNVWIEPAALTQTNDLYPQLVIRYKDTATKDTLGIRFPVPADYVAGAKMYFLCTSTATTGNFVMTLDYSSASTTSSLDPSSSEESLTVTQAAPISSQTGVLPVVTLTAANLAANDVFQGIVGRNGASGSDTMTADLIVYDIIFEYTN